jgi:hypothetical protein
MLCRPFRRLGGAHGVLRHAATVGRPPARVKRPGGRSRHAGPRQYDGVDPILRNPNAR